VDGEEPWAVGQRQIAIYRLPHELIRELTTRRTHKGQSRPPGSLDLGGEFGITLAAPP
jgi:hypothetical protein